jgi:hypothetical protein
MGVLFDELLGSLGESIGYWLDSPEPEKDPEDNVWEDFHVFDGEWVQIQNRMEWYESPNVPTIYRDHVYIFNKNMDFSRPEETFYKQNVDSNDFRSKLDARHPLPSGRGDMRIKVRISTKYPPSGENDFAMVEYLVDSEIKYDIPKGATFLPRIIARPLNNMYRRIFMRFIGEEMVERDGEFAIEKTREYFQYIRKYHGEEPVQTKSRQAEFTPIPEEGTFFE